jgi:hypothetical protein
MIFRRLASVVLLGLIGVAALRAAPAEPPAATAPITYALIIDITPAMRSQLVSFITLGQAFVESNTPADETAIITFAGRDNITLERNYTSRKAWLGRVLDNMFYQGGAPDLLDAVYLAADTLGEHAGTGAGKPVPANHALVLLTAGANADSFYRTEQVLAMLREKHVRVYVIGFPKVLGPDAKVETAARELCQQLGAGGRAYFPASKDEALMAAREILGLIRTQAKVP